MSLLGPNDEDKYKIHDEINQIVNQRLGLTTLSVLIFGTVIAWLIPKDPDLVKDGIGAFRYITSILLILVLLVLFILVQLLTRMLRVLTTYLDETGSSNWEKDWSLYRNQFKYLGYTKAQSLVFMFLGIISAGFPCLLCAAYHLKWEPQTGAIACFIIGGLYVVFVIGIGFFGWFVNEDDLRRRWKELNDK